MQYILEREPAVFFMFNLSCQLDIQVAVESRHLKMHVKFVGQYVAKNVNFRVLGFFLNNSNFTEAYEPSATIEQK